MDAPKTLRVRVSAEGDDYRESTRVSTVEVDASQREWIDEAGREKDIKREVRRLQRAGFAIAMLPFGLWLKAYFTPNLPSGLLESAGVIMTFLVGVILVVQWLGRKRTLELARKAHPTAATRKVVRAKQTFTLVGRAHRTESGSDKGLLKVRVETDEREGRASVVGEYEDGSTATLLKDLTEDEVDGVRACAAAHEISVA